MLWTSLSSPLHTSHDLKNVSFNTCIGPSADQSLAISSFRSCKKLTTSHARSPGRWCTIAGFFFRNGLLYRNRQISMMRRSSRFSQSKVLSLFCISPIVYLSQVTSRIREYSATFTYTVAPAPEGEKRKHHLCRFLSLTCRSCHGHCSAAPRANDTFSSYATMQHTTLRQYPSGRSKPTLLPVNWSNSSPESACQMKSSLTKGQISRHSSCRKSITPYHPNRWLGCKRTLKSIKTATSEGKNWDNSSPTSFLRIVTLRDRSGDPSTYSEIHG